MKNIEKITEITMGDWLKFSSLEPLKTNYGFDVPLPPDAFLKIKNGEIRAGNDNVGWRDFRHGDIVGYRSVPLENDGFLNNYYARNGIYSRHIDGPELQLASYEIRETALIAADWIGEPPLLSKEIATKKLTQKALDRVEAVFEEQLDSVTYAKTKTIWVFWRDAPCFMPTVELRGLHPEYDEDMFGIVCACGIVMIGTA